jgi:hypothetical protein
MSIIFPGNYVAHLNAYREQGVEAIPGVEFFKGIGALVLNPDNKGVLTLDADGNSVLAAGTFDLEILSPDLRQDDKPRKDKPFVIPAGSVVYRTAVSAPGVREVTLAGAATVTVVGVTTPTAVPLTAVPEVDPVTSVPNSNYGYFAPEGAVSAMESIVDGTAISVTDDTPVQVTTSADLMASLSPSAGACRNSPSAIMVEVCYYRPAPAPDAEDAHIPYATEAGSGT